MKKICTLFLVTIISTSSFAQQDTVANGDFELWGTNPFYDDVENWFTLNSLAQIFGAELAYQTTEASEVYEGSHSIKLVTTNLTGVGVTPSVLTNGSVNTGTEEIEGGVEISSRPAALNFAYRYDPLGSDSAIANITLTKWDAVNGTQVVGFAEAILPSSNGDWVNEQLIISYSSEEVPDTSLIFFTTSDDVGPSEGTTLYLDALDYSFSLASIDDAQDLGLEIYPNPVQNLIRINTKSSYVPVVADIFSLDGSLISSSLISNGVDVSGLPSGVYILSLKDKEGIKSRHNFVKQ